MLAVDAAGLACSVALAVDDRVASTERFESPHGQAERVLPMVDRALRQAGLSPAAVDVVVVTVGPGSFTGIRAGLAAARGITVATGARLIGVTSFEAVAAAATPHNRHLLVALESRRENLYVQLFDPRRGAVGKPAAMSPATLGDAVKATIGVRPLLIAGDAAQRAAASLSERTDTIVAKAAAPDAIGALRAALRRLHCDEENSTARPLYLRPPGVTSPPSTENQA